jgi:hypothetical protein
MGTSCVVGDHKIRFGRIWNKNFAGKSEFHLLLQGTEGLEFWGMYTTGKYILNY